MSHRPFSIFMVIALAIAVTCSNTSRAQDVYGDKSSADAELMEASKLGKKLARQGDVDRALRYFKRAYEIKSTYKTAGNLGNAELRLKHYRDAADHLREALRHVPVDQAAATVSLTKKLTAAKAHLLILSIQAPEDAKVFLDGKKLKSTALNEPVFVDPGKHTVYASILDDQSLVQTVFGKAGESQGIRLVIEYPQPEPPEQPGLSLPELLAITGGSLTFASLATSIGLTVWANDTAGAADEGAALVGNSGCVEPTGVRVAQCAELVTLREEQFASRDAALGMWVTTGVVTATSVGVVLMALLLEDDDETPSVAVVPSFGTAGHGVTVVGTW